MSKGAPNATNATRTSSAPTSEIEAFTDGTPAWFIDISARSFKDANQVSEPKGFVAAGCFKAEAKSFDVNKFEVTLDVTDPGFYPFPNHEVRLFNQQRNHLRTLGRSLRNVQEGKLKVIRLTINTQHCGIHLCQSWGMYADASNRSPRCVSSYLLCH